MLGGHSKEKISNPGANIDAESHNTDQFVFEFEL